MEKRIVYLERLIRQGGPEPADYEECNRFFHFIHGKMTAGELSRDEVRQLWRQFDPVFTRRTLQGFVCEKPHGYAGDFEIIDRIYQEWVAPEPELANWDRFFHWQPAPKAVRNRKAYFIEKFSRFAEEGNGGGRLQVLNVGSGPARDVREFFSAKPEAPLGFHCLDLDEKAIAYAQKLCAGLTEDQVRFEQVNIFRFKTERTYDFVWSAGLFDYLDEKQFVFLLRRLLTLLKPGGRMVIGNFAQENGARPYMEFGEWFLHHRGPAALADLAAAAGVAAGNVNIETEPEGVNLFLVMEKDG